MTAHRRRVAAGVGLALLVACARDTGSGPGRIAWDRDTCERCSMVIGERRFAAQIRDADGRLHRFDDVGCALLWQEEHAARPVRGFWVAAPGGEGWIAAASARFADGQPSPMGYGFAPHDDGPFGIAEVRARVREREDARRR